MYLTRCCQQTLVLIAVLGLVCLTALELSAQSSKKRAQSTSFEHSVKALFDTPAQGYHFAEMKPSFETWISHDKQSEKRLALYFLALSNFLDGKHRDAVGNSMRFYRSLTNGRKGAFTADIGAHILSVRDKGCLDSREVLKGICYNYSACRLALPQGRDAAKPVLDAKQLIALFQLIDIMDKAWVANGLISAVDKTLRQKSKPESADAKLDAMLDDGGDDGVSSGETVKIDNGTDARRFLGKCRSETQPCAREDFLATVGILALQTVALSTEYPGLERLILNSVSALQMRQIAMAMYLYLLNHGGKIPVPERNLKEQNEVRSWCGDLLPYFDVKVKRDYKDTRSRVGPRWELVPYSSAFIYPSDSALAVEKRIYADRVGYRLLFRPEYYNKTFADFAHSKVVLVEEKERDGCNRTNRLYMDGSVIFK